MQIGLSKGLSIKSWEAMSKVFNSFNVSWRGSIRLQSSGTQSKSAWLTIGSEYTFLWFSPQYFYTDEKHI